jgi:hypothetical protein
VIGDSTVRVRARHGLVLVACLYAAAAAAALKAGWAWAALSSLSLSFSGLEWLGKCPPHGPTKAGQKHEKEQNEEGEGRSPGEGTTTKRDGVLLRRRCLLSSSIGSRAAGGVLEGLGKKKESIEKKKSAKQPLPDRSIDRSIRSAGMGSWFCGSISAGFTYSVSSAGSLHAPAFGRHALSNHRALSPAPCPALSPLLPRQGLRGSGGEWLEKVEWSAHLLIRTILASILSLWIRIFSNNSVLKNGRYVLWGCKPTTSTPCSA